MTNGEGLRRNIALFADCIVGVVFPLCTNFILLSLLLDPSIRVCSVRQVIAMSQKVISQYLFDEIKTLTLNGYVLGIVCRSRVQGMHSKNHF